MPEKDKPLVEVECLDNIAVLTLNRPEKYNALTPALLVALHEAISELSRREEIRCLVLRGSGDKAFCSGYDLGQLPTTMTPEIAELLKENPNPLALGLEAITAFPYPVIAMLNGVAIGAGCELAVTCDIRIGADDIRMGMPPAKLGLVYAPSGIRKFLDLVGPANTRELFFTARFVDAARAREMGLVNYLLPRDSLEGFTLDMAREIAGRAPLALRGMKRIINMLLEDAPLDEAGNAEAGTLIAASLGSDDLKEGQRAFLEKRQPVFRGE